MSRDINAVQSEYTQVCAALGDLTYKHSQVEAELDRIDIERRKLQNKLLGLNKEAHKLRTEPEAPKAEEATPAVEVANETPAS